MRTWLVCAAMLAVGCTEKTPNTPTPGEGAPSSKAAAAPMSGPAGPVQQGLEQAVERCKKGEGSAHEIQRCTSYRRYLGKVRRQVGEYSPEVPTSIEPFLARMQVGFDRLGDADPWMRAGALGVVELGLIAAQYKPSDHTKGWVDRLVARAAESKDANERVSLLRIVGNHAGKDQQAGLLALAQSADAVGVRAAAWAALARCSDRGCVVTPEQLDAAWAKETSPKARGGLALLAGWTRSPKTAEWCAALLDDAMAGPSCRAALKRMGDDAAYGLLSARADRLIAAAAPPGDAAKDAEAASALADLTPLADLPVAGASVYDRVGAFMQAARHPQSLQRVAGQLLFMKDKVRARALAQAELKRVQDDPKLTLVANRLRRVVSALTEGEAKDDGHGHGQPGGAGKAAAPHGHPHGAAPGGAAPSAGHGDDHGHGEAAGDHGHDHGDHGHAH